MYYMQYNPESSNKKLRHDYIIRKVQFFKLGHSEHGKSTSTVD